MKIKHTNKMENKNKLNKYFIILSLLLSILALNFVSGAVSIVAPGSGTNNTGTITFNVSYVNGTDITTPQNATFYYNLSGTWTSVGIATTCSINACYGSLSTASLTSGYYSINATIYNLTAAAAKSATTLKTNVLIDNTNPTISSVIFKYGDVCYPADDVPITITASDTSPITYYVELNDTSTNRKLANYTSATPTFSSPSTDSPGYYKLTTIVTDKVGLTSTSTKYLTINSKSKANQITAITKRNLVQLASNFATNNKFLIIGFMLIVIVMFIIIVVYAGQK